MARCRGAGNKQHTHTSTTRLEWIEQMADEEMYTGRTTVAIRRRDGEAGRCDADVHDRLEQKHNNLCASVMVLFLARRSADRVGKVLARG